MTRVHVCLSWFREDPDCLVEMVESVAPFAASITAVDGPYPLLPRKGDTSSVVEYDAIRGTAAKYGIPVHFYAPGPLTEVEKRTVMFQRAAEHAGRTDDWLLVMDADEFVVDVHPERMVARLAGSDRIAADCMYIHRTDRYELWRKLFRALPGIYLDGTHYIYAVERNGVPHYLWHAPKPTQRDGVWPVAGVNLAHDLLIKHGAEDQEDPRRRAQQRYYDLRDKWGVESAGAVVRRPLRLRPFTEFGICPRAGDRVRVRLPDGEHVVSQAEGLRLLNQGHAEAIGVEPRTS